MLCFVLKAFLTSILLPTINSPFSFDIKSKVAIDFVTKEGSRVNSAELYFYVSVL